MDTLQSHKVHIDDFIQEALNINNSLRSVQMSFYHTLFEIQQYHNELSKLFEELKGKYKEHKTLQVSLGKLEAWEREHLDQHPNIPILKAT